MVKLVDTTDLKSVARVKPACRFDPGSGHQTIAFANLFRNSGSCSAIPILSG